MKTNFGKGKDNASKCKQHKFLESHPLSLFLVYRGGVSFATKSKKAPETKSYASELKSPEKAKAKVKRNFNKLKSDPPADPNTSELHEEELMLSQGNDESNAQGSSSSGKQSATSQAPAKTGSPE